MNLLELENMTRSLSRDNNSYMFSDAMVNNYINQGIDRLKQTVVFRNMVHLVEPEDVPILLPEQYHYLLSIFAASRCLEFDERFYEAIDRRNEFEQLLSDLLSEIETKNIEIVSDTDGDGKQEVLNNGIYIDYVTDKYFNFHLPDREVIIDDPLY